MDVKRFEQILDYRLDRTRDVLASKGEEYSSETDRLHNFKVAAKITPGHTTPEQALWGMMRKHVVSVMDIIDNLHHGELPSRALVDEKLGDMLNYTILLEALLVERLDAQCPAVELKNRRFISSSEVVDESRI